MEKRDAARAMYMEGFKQVDIARLLRVTENTIRAWREKESWDEKRISFEALKDNSAERIMRLIDYQLRALEKRTESWAADAEELDETPRLIERGDIDALQKLWTTIKREQKTWRDYLTTMTEFMEYLSSKDIELAKQVTGHADLFLNEKRKLL